MRALWALLRLFAQVAVFARSPADVPYSPTLLALCLTLQAGLSLGVASLLPAEREVVPSIAIGLGVMIGWMWLLFKAHGHGPRLVQCLTAMLGAVSLIDLVCWPLYYLAHLELLATQRLSAAVLVPLQLALLWTLAIYGAVLVQGLAISRWRATGYVLLFVIVQYNALKFAPAGT